MTASRRRSGAPAGGPRRYAQMWDDLLHSFEEAAVRDQHVHGWRFQLSLFANVVSEEVFANAAAQVDAWFEAWTIPDEAARRAAFERIALPGVRFSDRYGAFESLDDVVEHAGATLRFMPGTSLKRNGPIRHCQGSVLANWTSSAGSGTDLFVLASTGESPLSCAFGNRGRCGPSAGTSSDLPRKADASASSDDDFDIFARHHQ